MAVGFVARRNDGDKVWLFKEKDGAKVRDVRWGDFLNVEENSADGWTKIKWGSDQLFIRTENVTNTRPLEVIFLDVGQGDGCILILSETGAKEKIIVIDAGVSDNMMGFIKWRFGKLTDDLHCHAAVITHSDQDHYGGFQPIFEHDRISFERVYHNGIAERAGADLLGPSDTANRMLTGIMETHDQIKTLYSDPAVRDSKKYPKLIHTAISEGRVQKIEMLSTEHGTKADGKCWVPKFAPGDDSKAKIEIVGPVPKMVGGKAQLRWFGDKIGSTTLNDGKTKNGHSVILRLTIGKLRLLFGGDLNKPAEDHLLRHYSGIAANKPLADSVPEASKRLSADIMKCCHHGASDVTDEFLKAVNPMAYVVSSGDEESHAHPRPDLLGRLGKQGRGEAPLIFCTEILRSTREKGREEDFKKLRDLDKKIDNPATPEAERTALQKERTELQDHIQKRNVGVYGAITMRSDGEHIELSFRLERPRGKQLWQSYLLHHDPAKGWVLEKDAH